MERVGGLIEIKLNGLLYKAKGSFTYNLGFPKREAVIGSDAEGVHGYKEMPQAPSLEGAFTDSVDVDLKALMLAKDATLVLSLANGKVIVFRDAVYTGDGNVTTEEGEIEIMFTAKSAEEVR